jgi:hypothetical protein
MEDNQINGQKISKEAYCPNSFFDNGTISIGEFKTLDDAMNFPIKEIWCINRTEDNKFQSYKSQGSRLLIICSWNRSIQDSLKFVVAVIHKDKVGKVYYWDMNDLPLYPEERKNQYEGSLGDDATYTLYQIANNRLNCNTNMNKKLIRLTESDLRKIVKESVGIIINEMDDDYPVWQDDNGNSYYGNHFHQTNNFEKVKTLWVLETKGEPGEVFLSPQEAAQYAASEMVDAHKEDGFDVEELSKEMMANFDELQGWSFGNYYCTQVELMRKKQ